MNTATYSAECIHERHSHCDYEDCACRCHYAVDEDFDTDGMDAEEEVKP